MPYPLPLTRTEAYLAYKAGVIQQSDLKPSLAVPRNGIDAWLAYWTGLAADYPKREDGTPHILQEEEAYIAYLCGVVSEYPEKCLRRVGAYLRYLISARWGRPDRPLNREELYLSLIKTQFIPSGDPSSDITIEGTCKAPFVDVKMYGDTFQQTYTGKNLVGFPVAHLTDQDGLTLDFASDGTITVDGTRSVTSATNYNDSTLFNYQAGSFTLTVIPISGSFSGAAIGTRAHKANLGQQSWYQTYNSAGQYNQGTLTKTAEEIAEVAGIQLLIGSGTAVFNNFKFKLQVTVGSDHDTSFEPFVGGQPSPSPSYPQDINVVTGTQTVSINGTDYSIDLGSIKLCKLEDYQDYIYKDGDSWKVHKATANITLTTSGWSKSNATANNLYINQYIPNLINNSPLLATNLTVYSSVYIYNNDIVGICYNTTGQGLASIRIGVGLSGASTVTDFNSWLGSNPVTLYYALATPTDTTITDTTLIAQLDSLVNGGAENGTTYIKVSATDPNLPAKLYVEAPKYD